MRRGGSSGIVRTGIVTLGALIAATQAQAGLEICNDTNLLQSVAIGYKGDTDWVSEGWWNVDPGTCAEVVGGDLTKRYYYYYAEAEGREFEGQNYNFCVEENIFTITGDTNCEDRGFETLGFREIDTGETATEFSLSLVDQSVPPRPAPDPAPDAGGSQDGVTGGGTQTTTEAPVVPSVTVSLAHLSSGLPPGKYGDAFRVDALFQGCELEQGAEYCGFHAAGWKLRAYYDGPTPDDLLYALEEMPINTFLRLHGDMGETSGVHAAVVVRQVVPKATADPYATLRAAMQGDWADRSDRRLEFTVRGSEIYRRRDGKLVSTAFLQIADACEVGVGPGPVLIETDLSTRAPVCHIIDTLGDGVMTYQNGLTAQEMAFRRVR